MNKDCSQNAYTDKDPICYMYFDRTWTIEFYLLENIILNCSFVYIWDRKSL